MAHSDSASLRPEKKGHHGSTIHDPVIRQKKSKRGFAAMSVEKRRAIARLGGASVPADKRAFAKDLSLAARAGAIGGRTSHGGGRRRQKAV